MSRRDVLIGKLSDVMDPDNARALLDEVLREQSDALSASPAPSAEAPTGETMCLAQEWQRDGRGMWAMRACQYYASHTSYGNKSHSHSFGPWRYGVTPCAPAPAEALSADFCRVDPAWCEFEPPETPPQEPPGPPQDVAEPWSLFLMGTGLIAAGRRWRRA